MLWGPVESIKTPAVLRRALTEVLPNHKQVFPCITLACHIQCSSALTLTRQTGYMYSCMLVWFALSIWCVDGFTHCVGQLLQAMFMVAVLTQHTLTSMKGPKTTQTMMEI
jgi:hypothetical protein